LRVGEELTRERDHQRLLLEVNNAVVSHLDLDALFKAVSACLRTVVQHDGSSLLLCNADTGQWRIHVLDFERNESFIEEGMIEESTCSPSCQAITTGISTVFGEQDLKEMAGKSPIAQDLLDRGVKSFCSLPLLSHNRTLGALNIVRILGVFSRLVTRDGKARYAGFMPRMWRYLDRCLAEPGLAGLKAWLDRHAPSEVRV